MKYQLSILAAALMVAGCNGSGSGSGSDTSTPTYTVSGSVTAQAAKGNETVCVDLNSDFICDSGEPSTSASNGQFSITSTNKSILNSPLVVELDTGVTSLSSYGSANAKSASANAFLVSPGQQKTSGNEINAITTLVASQVVTGASLDEAIRTVKAQLVSLGLPASDNLLKEGSNNEYVALENNLLTIISAMDKAGPDYSLAVLTQNLEDYKDVLLSNAPSEEDMKRLLDDLDNSSKTVALNDTGVTTYFTDGGDNTVVQADYPGQDADFGFDATANGFKFVKLDANGQPLAADATEWSCVKDERSGLIWETKSDDENSPQFKDRFFVYQVSGKFEPYSEDVDAIGCKAGDGICSTEEYVKYLNEQKVCGMTTWRLPTFGEFFNLIDFGETEKDDDDEVYGLNRKYFPRQSKNSDFGEGEIWTSTEFFTEHEIYKTPGAMYIEVIQTRGEDRGTTYAVEIYSDKVKSDWGTSYQLPIRLVSKGETN